MTVLSRNTVVYRDRFASHWGAPLAWAQSHPGLQDTLTVTNVGTTVGNFKDPNSFAYTHDEINYNHGWSKDIHPTTSYYQWTGGTTGSFNAGENRAADLAYADQVALNRLSEKVRGNLDASIDAFQYRQSAKMIKAAGRFVSESERSYERIVKAVAGRRIRSITKLIDAITSAHLGYIYGVKPTLQTMFDLALHSRDHYCVTGQTFSARAKEVSAFQGVINASYPNQAASAWTIVGSKTRSRRCEYSVKMVLPNNDTTSAARLTSLNPVSIAYELLPWSFVLDWGYNLGGYLRDLETAGLYGAYFKSGYKTSTYKDACVWTGQPVNQRLSIGHLSGAVVNTGYTRTKLTSYPAPNLPRFRLQLGAARALAAFSLGWQLLSRTERLVSRNSGIPLPEVRRAFRQRLT